MSKIATRSMNTFAALVLLAVAALLPGLHDAAAAKSSRGLADGDHGEPHHRHADADIRVVVVAMAGGIDFLLDGALDEQGNSYDAQVDPLMLEGVEFRVCNNTLKGRHIDKDKLLPDVQIVPAGVAELARLQLDEGAAYIRP